MPSEPDKKMEDLLRTYARKRREDAGESPEMHPATRRILQAEAAKLRPKEATQRTPWAWLMLRWPRVAFAAGLFVLLAIAVWNGIPERRPSSLLAKREEQPVALSRARDAGREKGAVEAELGDRFEQDKAAPRPAQPEAVKLTERSLDEVRDNKLLREPAAQTDVKLKTESTSLGSTLQKAPAGGLKDAETDAAVRMENLATRRTLDAAATSPRFAGGPPANRPAPQSTSDISSGVNLPLAPKADASGKQGTLTYSAPGSAPAVDSLSQLSVVKQTNAVALFKNPANPSLGAERLTTDYGRIAPPAIVPPAAPSPSTTAGVAFDARNEAAKAGRADLEARKLDGASNVSLAERSQVRARVTNTGEVLLVKKATGTALLRQSVRFKRQAGLEESAPTKAAIEPASGGVLSTFEFEQDGDRVRLIDSDGSVYAGQFVNGVEADKARFAEFWEAQNQPAPAGGAATRRANVPDTSRSYVQSSGSAALTTNRVFRVNGTNRTSGQLVTIEALLSAGSEEAVNGLARGLTVVRPTSPPPATKPGAKAAVPAQVGAAVVPADAQEARHMVGVLRFGASNEMKLFAVPVAK